MPVLSIHTSLTKRECITTAIRFISRVVTPNFSSVFFALLVPDAHKYAIFVNVEAANCSPNDNLHLTRLLLSNIIGNHEKNYYSILFVFFLIASVYPQTELDLDWGGKIENIFKAHNLKIKYETVQYIYNAKGFPKNDSFLNSSFELIRGFPYFEEAQDTISEVKHGKLMNVEWMSKEEINRYIERLNCTPEEAYKEYKVFLRNIQLEKDMYLRCIDIELAKGGESEYAKDEIFYSFGHPWSSLLPPIITKLDFLKVFKEFVLDDNNGDILYLTV